MADAFIIMQIGNHDLDRVYANAIAPAVRACGLEPKRVDKHTKGGLLKSAIDAFIQEAQIVIGDLTNERPNCYLEIGYAMGVGKLINLILTCRDDHQRGNANHKIDGPRVRFDLEGYDILFWDSSRLVEFRAQLERKIRKRIGMLVQSKSDSQALWDQEWLSKLRVTAVAGLQIHGMSSHMEIRSALLESNIKKSSKELVEAAQRAQIHTFGWPMGLVSPDPSNAPYAAADGIVAEMYNELHHAYDYWSMKHNGDFFLLRNLYEDTRTDPCNFGDATNRGLVYFNMRIHTITEALLHTARLYQQLGMSPTTGVAVAIRHSGLKGRHLSVIGSNFLTFPSGASREDTDEHEIQTPIGEIESELVNHVKAFAEPLFMYFGFTEFQDSLYEKIVRAYVDGQAL